MTERNGLVLVLLVIPALNAYIFSFLFFFSLNLFCYVVFLIFQADTNSILFHLVAENLILHIFLIIMIIMPCSGMFRNVPGCSGMFHVPGFIDALFKLRGWSGLTNTMLKLRDWKGLTIITMLNWEAGVRSQITGRNMSIISKVDKSRSLSIEFDTNQLTSIGNR